MIRRVRLDEHPLQLLFRFLQEIGHTNPGEMQVEGIKEDLAPLFKFVAGEMCMHDQSRLWCGVNAVYVLHTLLNWSTSLSLPLSPSLCASHRS